MSMVTSWTVDDRGRHVGHYRSGAWLKIPLAGGMIVVPPNGITLPYSIAGTLLNEPKPNGVSMLHLGHAIRWLESVYGDDLAQIVQPFREEHDFTLLCGGTSVQFVSSPTGWEMSYRIRSVDYSHASESLGRLMAKLPDLFGPGSPLNLSEARQAAFMSEAADMVVRLSIMDQIAASIWPKDHRSREDVLFDVSHQQWTGLATLDDQAIRTHRLALGKEDQDTFDVAPKSWETLFDQLRRSD